MVDWKEKLAIVGVVSLLFFGIPIRVDEDENKYRHHHHREEMFKHFVSTFNKTYGHDADEYLRRFGAFQRQLELIEELNGKRMSNDSARYGLTRFSDMTPEEFRHRHLKNKVPLQRLSLRALRSGPLPPKIDWREKSVVTRVYDQKTCGACWAFSVVETIESMAALKTGALRSLSVQEAIDCTPSTMGCDGGDICSLLDWLRSTRTTVEPAAAYPLELRNDACRLKTGAGAADGVVVEDYTCDTFVGDEDALRTVLALHGPVAVAVNALTWQNYLGGVVQFHCDGSPTMLNHAVQIVGYDMTGEIPFYIARNSWGPDFGDGGYLRIAVGGNVCGVAVEVASVIV